MAVTKINGCQGRRDRIALIPPDVAAFWRQERLQNLGMGDVVDF